MRRLSPAIFSVIVLLLAGCSRAANTPTVVAAVASPTFTASPATPPPATPSPVSPPPASPPPTSPPPTLTPTATPTLTPTLTSTPTLTPTPTATPGPTPDGVVRNVRVPILMYHYVSQPPADADVYRTDLSVDATTFSAHLDYLQAEGYTTIPLKDLLSHLAIGRPELPAKPIVITFDDGYLDNYENAFPALRQHGMIGAFFVITDFATQERHGYMTWSQIKEMADAGMEIGSHSRDHPNLKGKDVDYLVWQALGSKEAIEANVGYHPHILSYPAGSYDQLVIDVFRSAHFWGAVTTQQGVTQSSVHPFELKRVRIRHTTGVEQLAALLAAAWPD